jgi:hypothetical protein
MSSRSCLLHDPTDWDAFEQGYILKATGERVSHLARLPTPSDFYERRAKPPKQPRIEDYMKKTPAAGAGIETRTSLTQFVRGNEPAERFMDLLPEDLEEVKLSINIVPCPTRCLQQGG